uniref:Uncharacterized protein n=1 Tax=Aplanochytrium stocchinoi TaxID=215587 RepID=A0A7S3PN52_9STRA|mmetsp:Transcript_6872/g.7853  ORF Transcript_6872/g.7853 Transcript_6872/m.7853 type:complete len:251 (-) Transcript_6872:24-776(-)|eukprot:CAMPEP_0204829922 /NCGR_PEP_ID=MMETSP1346-20131115/8225_1 /ASSEMBLY_ACC=CAM_ASM_000771 /TAXON_ID=215587 /ORGANISM="Aplanochytrium stocchinoi, Strain GSBS06" /LENGTH=250 /DNA_ID=CAMNT_0051960015 /DNA_START=186 /DNA_END=938 /DNA_ORIENTATION=+
MTSSKNLKLIEIPDKHFEPVVSQTRRKCNGAPLWVFRVPADFDVEQLDGISLDIGRAVEKQNDEVKKGGMGESGVAIGDSEYICHLDDPVLAQEQIRPLVPSKNNGNVFVQGTIVEHFFTVDKNLPNKNVHRKGDNKRKELTDLLQKLTPPNARVPITFAKLLPPPGESWGNESPLKKGKEKENRKAMTKKLKAKGQEANSIAKPEIDDAVVKTKTPKKRKNQKAGEGEGKSASKKSEKKAKKNEKRKSS